MKLSSQHEIFSTRLLVLVVTTSLLLFIVLCGMLGTGQMENFDQSALRLLRSEASFDDPWGPAWLEEVLRDVTALGSRVILVLVIFTLSILLLVQGRKTTAMSFTTAAIIIVALNTALKFSIDRPRPQIVEHEAQVFSPSFPSAHAMESSSIFLISAFLVCLLSECRRSLKVFTFSLAIFTIFAVGLSRMYLGVHYPSDIFSGWLMGVACAGVFMLIAQGRWRTQDPDLV